MDVRVEKERFQSKDENRSLENIRGQSLNDIKSPVWSAKSERQIGRQERLSHSLRVAARSRNLGGLHKLLFVLCSILINLHCVIVKEMLLLVEW